MSKGFKLLLLCGYDFGSYSHIDFFARIQSYSQISFIGHVNHVDEECHRKDKIKPIL